LLDDAASGDDRGVTMRFMSYVERETSPGPDLEAVGQTVVERDLRREHYESFL
jgi:hypothetical protein